MPTVRRDIHNVVFPVDLADAEDISMVVQQIQHFIKKRIPVRFGIVPTFQEGASREQAKVARHLLHAYGLGAFMGYLEKVSEPLECVT